jgi:hypothetical protein
MSIDSWTTEHEGVKYRVQIEPDYDAKPTDYDCYTPKQVTAWGDDRWQFVGVVVSALLDGLDPEWFTASLWGIEYGSLPLTDEADNLTGETYDDGAYIRNEVVPDLISEVWGDAKDRLLDIRAKISAQLYKMGS